MAETSYGHWDELIPSSPGLKTMHGLYLFLGVSICFLSLFSLVIKNRLFLSNALIASILGVIFGPRLLGIFDPYQAFDQNIYWVLLELSRIILCIQCTAAGVSLPGSYVMREWRSLAVLLGVGMIGMWVISAAGLWLILGLDGWTAFIIAACITPTDPILAGSILEGRFAEQHIPVYVRDILTAESAANDGLGLPFLMLVIYLQRFDNKGEAIGLWLGKVVLYQIMLSIVVGMLFGIASRKALKHAEHKGWIDKAPLLSYSIALAISVTGVMSLMGADDILASFVAGTMFTWDMWFNKQIQHSHLQEIIDMLLDLAYFILFGAMFPWSSFGTVPSLSAWRIILACLFILLFRRLPVIMLLRRWVPALKTRKEAFFCGWFGPMGASALFYAMLCITYLELPADPIFPIVAACVLSSIIVHGGTVSLFHFGITRTQTYRSWRDTGHGGWMAFTRSMRGVRTLVMQERQGDDHDGAVNGWNGDMEEIAVDINEEGAAKKSVVVTDRAGSPEDTHHCPEGDFPLHRVAGVLEAALSDRLHEATVEVVDQYRNEETGDRVAVLEARLPELAHSE
ncbi:Sodium/hydrogen exchanger family-domain-containing protein [Fimicolochytrium jonesii]|uniref:Sodium/hydrogen exchanger family-domain-containing protein n=1 Tax=Fimicolochytrium jonesii TaxID=1396493 RepID=UPI0022FF1ACC|nr:Sodium/hydrogen exchanger family-domain-containing protein [Fimicolochytrium jonesii]KAI8816459.1 Sodium/hydrogen exchanger family-domain-containing protein [Fimicolochytrium jonesii]